MFAFGNCCSNVVTADFTTMPIAILFDDSIDLFLDIIIFYLLKLIIHHA